MMYRIGTVGWIAITVIIILVLLWIIHSAHTRGYMPDGVFKDTYESMISSAHRTYDRYLETPENLWTRTVGYENDEAVQMAINKATKLEEMHHSNSHRLATTAADAAMNSFILAELNRFNVAPTADPDTQLKALDHADIMYRRTLYRLRNNPVTVVRNTDFAETMLDRIETFEQERNRPNEPLLPIIDETRQNIRQARVNLTFNGKFNKKTRSEYFAPRDVRNDPQNVHDTELTHDLKIKFQRIKQANMKDLKDIHSSNYTSPTIDDIRIELNKATIDETTRERAGQILSAMSNGSSVTSLGTTEKNVLLEVWKRINSSDNNERRDELKKSFWESLASGMEPNYSGDVTSVCTVGRCSRVLDSLTLLDSDTSIAKPPQTVDVLRNEILAKSYKILQDSLKDSPIASVYNGSEPETDDNRQELNNFKMSVLHKIETTIKKDYPDAKPETLDNIIKDAQAGV